MGDSKLKEEDIKDGLIFNLNDFKDRFVVRTYKLLEEKNKNLFIIYWFEGNNKGAKAVPTPNDSKSIAQKINRGIW